MFFNGQVRELSYLHACETTYATLCQGTYQDSVRYRDFMGWDVPWYSVHDSRDALMAGRGPFMLACYLRQGERVFETYWTTGRDRVQTDGVSSLTPHRHFPIGHDVPWVDVPLGIQVVAVPLSVVVSYRPDPDVRRRWNEVFSSLG